MIKIIFSTLTILFISLTFNGCGSITQPDLELVKKYKQPVNINSNEKLVYIIRESMALGGARGLWIAHNKNVIADLGSGDYTYLKVPIGINTIHAVQTWNGMGYTAVDENNNEPVFMKFLYDTGKMEILPTDIGITYIMKYDQKEPLSIYRKNDAYELGVMNLARFNNLKIMTNSEKLLIPSEDTSIITFFNNNSESDWPTEATIWNSSTLIGNIYNNSFFQIRVPKGKHTFYVKGQVYYALQANCQVQR